MVRKKHTAIIIFPYLFAHDGLKIEDLEVKPSFDKTIKKEPSKIKEFLTPIARCFRMSGGQQIFQWSYITTCISSREYFLKLKEKLDRFTTVARYVYLSDERTGGEFANFDYFVFEITPQQEKHGRKFRYLEGILNGETSQGFHIRDDKCEVPYQFPRNIRPLVLTNLNNPNTNEIFKIVYLNPRFYLSEREEKKLLGSLRWFNKSFAITGETDLGTSVVHMAITLESLLRGGEQKEPEEHAGIKAQIKSAMMALLGDSPDLEHWINKFWELRNALIHGSAKVPSFYYVAKGGTKAHRNNLDLARSFFTRCVKILLRIRSTEFNRDIHEQLVSNEVRIKEATRLLKEAKEDTPKAYKNGALDLVASLRSNDVTATKQGVQKFGKLFIPIVIKDLKRKKQDDITEKAEDILKWKGRNLADLSLVYYDFEKVYSPFYFSQAMGETITELALRGAAYNFIGFAGWRLLTFYD